MSIVEAALNLIEEEYVMISVFHISVDKGISNSFSLLWEQILCTII